MTPAGILAQRSISDFSKKFALRRNQTFSLVVYMGEGTNPGAGKECPMEDEKIIELYWQRSPQAIDETSRKYLSLIHI